MLAGLARGRAAARDYLLSPVAAVPLTGVAAIASAVTGVWTVGLGAGTASQLLVGTALSTAIGYAGGRMLAVRGNTGRVYQRGARVTAETVASAGGRGEDRVPTLSLAGMRVKAEDEVKHFKMIGTTGTGKSTAIAELLDGALARGDRAVIADPDGGYRQRFYQPSRGDLILNPFDERSVRWDPFREIDNPYDVDELARALIPDHDGQDRSWRGYARTFFSAVTRQLKETGAGDAGELYRLLVVAEADELRGLVRGTPAQPFLDEKNARMFDSIRSVTASATAPLEYISRQQGPPFSIREWIRERDQGVLFMPYQAGQIAALRSSISAWMRIAIFETMNGQPEPAGKPPRTWFVVDELDALGQIDGMKDALARVRKFGGRCVLGFQSVAQVSSTYGQGEAHTIVENCSNTLILRCSASEGGGTARFASQLIGDREVMRETLSVSRRPGEFLGSRTRSQHYALEAALLPSEIEQLPDMAGYLKLASSPGWQRVALSPRAHDVTTATAGHASQPVPRLSRDMPRDSWGRE
jgi:type IV secretory pathway TraG/TraD family ATPase VirD4